MKATAIANANIALVKYWGKRDKKLFLPNNGSISMTCDGMQTKTTIEFSPDYDQDTLTINNDTELIKESDDLKKHIDLIRSIAGISDKAKIVSETNFPVAAGLASSASGYAALTAAATKALGMDLDEKALSILTRRGSGSACRSICEGFVEWYKGTKEDGSDSYAESIAGKNHWPEFRMIATIVSEAKKKVSSRAGMAQTVETCPYYKDWLATVDNDLETIRNGIKKKDFITVAETAEYNCLKMHATMITTKPPIIYWIPATMEIINNVLLWREEGLHVYYTIDAGPQVKIICLEKDVEEINRRLLKLNGVIKTIICKPGDGVKFTNKHLF